MTDKKQNMWYRIGRGFSRKDRRKKVSRSRTTPLQMEFLEPRLTLSGINLSFRLDNTNYTPSNTYVTFIGGSLSATYDNGKTVDLNHSYTITELNGPIKLYSYSGGQIYVSLGAGVAGVDPPEAVDPTIPSYYVRHDKIDITYSDSNDDSSANLTAVDFFAIPMQINTYQSGSITPVETLTYDISPNTLISDLAALAGDSNEVLLKDLSGNFLRVLSPYTETLSGTMRYPSLQNYIDAVRTWQSEGTPVHEYTTIDDLYEGNGTTPATQTQKYHFQATIEADGSLKLVGGGEKVGGGLWLGGDHTILVAAAGLADGIYRANVTWTVDGNPGSFADNDVYAAAMRDVIAGFNLGFIASATVDTATGLVYGLEASKYWWNSTQAFQYLQPYRYYYNQYAQQVSENSDADSWAFPDRWQTVEASLYGMQTVEIVVMTDSSLTMSPGLYNPATSTFYLRNSNSSGYADTTALYGPAGEGWIPINGDWTGIGYQTIGLYNMAASAFYLKNSNTSGYSDNMFYYGQARGGYKPLVGDWTDSGRQTVGLYDQTTSTFFLKNYNTSGYADIVLNYGPAYSGWTPLTGDWDGNGTQTVGLYNPITSTFYLRNSNTTGYADITFNYGPARAGWLPIVGDWNGDGTDTIGLYNPNSSTYYLRNSNSTGYADTYFNYGPPGQGWTPIAGNWTGKASLVAADGVVADSQVSPLIQSELPPIVDEAIARWKAAGLDAAMLEKLQQVEIVVGDLSGVLLGQAEANRIVLDSDAAGHGWFVDLTPETNEEYAASSSGLLHAVDPRAVDRIDLLSVVRHELGHIIGLDDLSDLSNDVMSAALSVAVRR